ncbi:MAG: alpha/beta hydrolase [Deltaproteobacteria bacterium]|nr:alpha/beta hydrolase [Deltaproteobacteria bacterium]
MEHEYVDQGSGKPVVLIPGMEGTKEFWRFQQAVLRARYRTIVVEYPRRRPSLGTTVADYAVHVTELLDALGVARAAFVGESFGGVIAQEIATSHAHRVEALVLCNTMDRARYDHFGLNMFTLATVVHMSAFALPMRYRRPILRWVGSHRGFVLDPSPGNEALIDYILEYGTLHGLGANIDRMIAGSKARYAEKLASITAPTLLLRGTEDRVVSHATMEAMKARIPGAELALIEGGGHCCQVTLPDETNRVLVGWLERIGYR